MIEEHFTGEYLEQVVEKHGQEEIEDNSELVMDVATAASKEQLNMVKNSLQEIVDEIEEELDNSTQYNGDAHKVEEMKNELKQTFFDNYVNNRATTLF